MTMMTSGLAGGFKSLGQMGSALSDYAGNIKSSQAQTAGIHRARRDLNQGYDQSMGFQQPIYNQSLGQYQNLSHAYNTGGFDIPHMEAYQFNPNQVFQDPEYQAQMRAGSQALNAGAQGKGTLFSGANDRDLMQYGQDLFANRSDALYNRGFNAQNTAFNQNLAGTGQNFNQGLALTQPLAGSAQNLSSLSTQRGADLASLNLGQGMVDSNKEKTKYGIMSKFSGQQGDNYSDFWSSMGGLGMG